jgi:hypothetical protein
MNAALILRRASASRSSGVWNQDDFDVLADGAVVGRIMKSGGLTGVGTRRRARYWSVLKFVMTRARMNQRSASPPSIAISREGHPIMKKLGMLGIIGGAALLTVAPFSLQWSQDEVSLSLNSANARSKGLPQDIPPRGLCSRSGWSGRIRLWLILRL